MAEDLVLLNPDRMLELLWLSLGQGNWRQMIQAIITLAKNNIVRSLERSLKAPLSSIRNNDAEAEERALARAVDVTVYDPAKLADRYRSQPLKARRFLNYYLKSCFHFELNVSFLEF
ncbi:hypothetical protein KI387_014615, partial [Taxus chinensis]